MPLSAFYDHGDVRHYARFAFCKQDHVLEEAIERLAKLFA